MMPGLVDQIGSSVDKDQIGSSGDKDQIGSSVDKDQIGSSVDKGQIGSSVDKDWIGSSVDKDWIGSSVQYLLVYQSVLFVFSIPCPLSRGDYEGVQRPQRNWGIKEDIMMQDECRISLFTFRRRTEDAQQTLVNGLQESGLHTTTISVSSATSPMSHLTKRLSLAPSANSVTNNTNETYGREMNESDNQVTGSEANGPSGLHREDISDTLTETTEPPSKKVKTTDDTFEDKATGSADEMPQIQEEKCNSFNPVHDAESMEAEASEDGSDTSSSSSDSSSAKAEAMELREAEATCHTVKVSEEKEVNLSQERLGQQVGTSELVPQDSTELTKEVRHKIEDKDESLSSVSPEVCSSNSSHRSVPEKLEEENDTTDVLSTSAAATTNAEGSPDSVEGTSEVVHQQFEQMKDTTQDEREGSSEAAAAAANSSRSELAHVSEMPCIEEEKSKDSHEADSTSQAQSNSVSSQPTSSPVATSPSATSSPSPSSDASSATPPDPSIAPSVASPPDTAAHTTSQTLSSSSASSPTPVTASTSSPVRDSPDPTTGTDNAASTSSSSLPQSDSTVGQEPDNTSSDSPSVETNNKNEKDAGNVSCSSSQSNESEVKNQLMK
ncbi:hypothetical protein Hamer_G008601 [Homarus americanus]|uniref:Uncharacterized protein n=1 Tax=Homarus americanus TaxID=6706 RepID=A0A8J5N5B0_HOMAM|nr:hypothetical protein Hamer_G008601 [Homarus americanus]